MGGGAQTEAQLREGVVVLQETLMHNCTMIFDHLFHVRCIVKGYSQEQDTHILFRYNPKHRR
jgi:hypothetical protein